LLFSTKKGDVLGQLGGEGVLYRSFKRLQKEKNRDSGSVLKNGFWVKFGEKSAKNLKHMIFESFDKTKFWIETYWSSEAFFL
jgi:hypothetical protein